MLKLKYTARELCTVLMGGIMAQKMPRSAWDKGVRDYAVWHILDGIRINGFEGEKQIWTTQKIRELILNGAKDYENPNSEYRAWYRYSEGGCALIYNIDIAKQLCSPSAFKKAEKAIENETSETSWIKIQAHALFHAAQLIYKTFKEMEE